MFNFEKFRRVKNFLAILLIFLLAFVWVFSGWPRIWQNPPIPPEIQQARANTTGQVYPTLGESVNEAPWSDDAWVTPTNIYSDDAATANVVAPTFDTDDQTYVLKATGFDFSAIPDNSTINGVTVRLNAWYRSGVGSGSVDLCQLLDTSKAKVGTNNCSTAVALTTDDTTIITKGSASDLWGNALDAAWVKNANFGVAIGILATAKNADVYVDYVTIEIDYTPPSETVSCSTEPAQTGFETLTVDSIFTATSTATTTMACNYAAGCTLYVKDAGDTANPGLYSAGAGDLINSSAATLSAGVEGYGIQAATTTAGTGVELLIAAAYKKTWESDDVGAFALTNQTLTSSDDPISGKLTIVNFKAAISGLNKAGNYIDTITFECTGN